MHGNCVRKVPPVKTVVFIHSSMEPQPPLETPTVAQVAERKTAIKQLSDEVFKIVHDIFTCRAKNNETQLHNLDKGPLNRKNQTLSATLRKVKKCLKEYKLAPNLILNHCNHIR